MTMAYDELLGYCLAKPGAWRDEPWEGDAVAKVGDKIFVFMGAPHSSGAAASIGVKCGTDPLSASEWRERFPEDASVMAYIGRFGWNTLTVGGAIPDDEIREAVDSSYDAVVAKLPRSRRPPT